MDRDRGGERKGGGGGRSRLRDESVLHRTGEYPPLSSSLFLLRLLPLPIPLSLSLSLSSLPRSPSRGSSTDTRRSQPCRCAPCARRVPVSGHHRGPTTFPRPLSLPSLCRHGRAGRSGRVRAYFTRVCLPPRASTRAAAFPFRQTRTTSSTPSLSISSSRLFSPVRS